MPAKELSAHVEGCIAKPVACVYCDLPIPMDKFDEHRVQCESRTRPCDMCSRPVMNKEYFGHLDVCLGPAVEEQPVPSRNDSNQYIPFGF